MKEILEELKSSMNGIVGSLVVGNDGEVIAKDVPDLMEDQVFSVSKTLHHVTSVIKATRSVDKLTLDTVSVKLISLPSEDRTLTVITEKNVNLPLFNLMSDIAITKIKDAPVAPKAPKKPKFDAGRICDLYDQLYGAAANRLANIIGPKSATHFKEGAEAVKTKYPNFFNGMSFGSSGKPDMITIRSKAVSIPTKDELIKALDELLQSMLESVEKVAGPKQEQRAVDEIAQLKSEYGGI